MIRWVTLFLLLTSAVGCAAPAGGTARPPSPAANAPVGETRVIILQATRPAPMSAPSATLAPAATPTVRSGWKTYTDTRLHLAVDYPPDWTVRGLGAGAVFTSPQGATIELAPIDPRAVSPNGEIVQPNTLCTNSVNPHGIAVRRCRATIGFSLDAYLEYKLEGGTESALVLSARNTSTSEEFNALMESARIVP